MSTQNQPSGGQPQQVNLQQIAQQFMVGLQRHFDMLAFNLAARESVREADYDRHASAPRIMPAGPRHQNFEQMQAYSRDLMVRQVVNDALNLAVTAMNNGHFFLALIKTTDANKNVSPEAQKAAQELQKVFAPAQLDEKFNRLEKDYGIMCELEDSITSLGFILQALVQQQGVVKQPQLDEQGKLILELKSVQIEEPSGPDQKPAAKLVERTKIFSEDEPVLFEDLDLQLILVTVASFADSFFKSVAEYAKSKQSGGDEA